MEITEVFQLQLKPILHKIKMDPFSYHWIYKCDMCIHRENTTPDYRTDTLTNK